MKNFLKILALTITILMVAVPVFASEAFLENSYFDNYYDTSIVNGLTNNTIRVQLNGDNVDFTDENGNKVEPQIINDRTMVPMRKIFEVLGADVEWIPETRSIKSNANGVEINLQINNKLATVKEANGEVKEIELDSTPTIVNDRTLVPVRFIAESLDKKVGWDAQNKMVIIIDSSIIEKTLKEKTPNFYEFLTIKPKEMTSAEVSLELDGKIKIKNETLNIDGEMDMKLSEKAIAFEIEANLNGSKNLMQEIENQKLNKISFEFILDMEKFIMYVKSPLIENSNNKWTKYESGYSEEEIKEAKAMLQEYIGKEKINVIDAIEELFLPSESLTNTTYSELESILQIISMVMNDKNFKVSGKTDKIYSFEFDLKDLAEALGFTGSLEEIEDEAIFGISLDVKMKDGIAKESKFYLLFGEKIDDEEESIELTLNSTIESYNEPINITMPSGKNILDGNKMQEEETNKVSSQAAFAGFASEMGDLQDTVAVAMLTAKGNEAIIGNRRTDAQLYNFVARGGYDSISGEEWLNEEDASNISYTKIDSNYAANSLGISLPNRKTTNSMGEVTQMSYYVTPKGNVFCWPPYEFDGKRYVTSNVLVTENASGEEIINFTIDNEIIKVNDIH